MIKTPFQLMAVSPTEIFVLFALACRAASTPAPAGQQAADKAERKGTAVRTPTQQVNARTSDTPVPATATLAPTSTLEPGPPETSSVTVWPSLTRVEPSTASPGQTLTIAEATVIALHGDPEPSPTPARFSLRTNAFSDGGKIPTLYTCDGDNVSPALSWGVPPAGAETLVLIMDDPDAPVGVWDHWVLFNLPASASELPQGAAGTGSAATGGVQGANSWGESAYGGPCPPKGPAHNYRFFLYAIDTTLDLQPGAAKSQALNALEGHVLAEKTLTGTYKRAEEQPAVPSGYDYS